MRRGAPFRRGAEVSVAIDRLAYGGRGVGRVNGYVVFVPDTAPGDRARARLWRVKPGYAEADLVEIEVPSPRRTTPPCPHFGPCGGCTWQHLGYDDQLDAKTRIVRESLAHIAGLRDVAVEPILAAPDPWAYRNKMDFAFHPDATLGLHQRGSFDHVVPITRCLIQSDAANEVLRIAGEWAQASGLSRYDARAHTGLLRQVVIREGRRTGEMMVALIATAREVPRTRELADRLLAAVPRIQSILLATNPGASDGLPPTGVEVLAGRAYILEELGGLRFRIGLDTFFQTNTLGAEQLVETVGRLAAPRGNEIVYDLYSGVGTFSLPLARRVRHVHGLEIVPPAVDAARENAALNGISNVEFVAGDVRRLLPDLAARGAPDLVLLDPPRSGAGTRVMRKVIATAAPRVIYVSCNPTTLAPDLGDLVQAGYTIRTVQPIDLFPQTYHVECVTLLERRTAPDASAG